MKLAIVCAINGAIFGTAAYYFGALVLIPLVITYFVGVFHGMD